MGQLTLRVGDRSHIMSCKDGEEEHLLHLAAMVDRKCSEATQTLGVMPEPRLLLTAALLIADELTELRGNAAAPGAEDAENERLAAIASRIESLCSALEQLGANA